MQNKHIDIPRPNMLSFSRKLRPNMLITADAYMFGLTVVYSRRVLVLNQSTTPGFLLTGPSMEGKTSNTMTKEDMKQ